MTSCLLLKAPDRLVAVADGRLATSETTRSFDTAEKIRPFTPKYQIPRVSMGRFDHYDESRERDWFLAYAGTYALASQIGDLFIQLVSGGLYLNRGEDGAVRFDHEFDQNRHFDDSYNFKNGELLPIIPRVIVEELLYAAQTKCDEWTRNGRDPDCEFLLFGEHAETHRYTAFKITPDLSRWRRGDRVQLRVQEIGEGVIESIGSTDVAKAVAGDLDLQAGIGGWQANQSEIAFDSLLADEHYADLLDEVVRPAVAAPLVTKLWTADEVEERFLQILGATNDKFVGGDFRVVTGFGYGLKLKTVKAG